MQPHPYRNRFDEEGAGRAREESGALAREVLANQGSPNCHRRRPALSSSALSPRTHESGRPGSNRRRPAWEAFWALVGQDFFGGGSRNGITQYGSVRFRLAISQAAGGVPFTCLTSGPRRRSRIPARVFSSPLWAPAGWVRARFGNLVPRHRLDEAGRHEIRTEFGDLVHVGAAYNGAVLGRSPGGPSIHQSSSM